MANNPKKITVINKVSSAQLTTLANGGTVTKGSDTLTASEDALYLIPDTSSEIPTTTNAGQLLKSTSTSDEMEWGTGLPYLTTAPSAANTDGLKLVVLSSDPATKYSGYFYIITTSNS